MTTGALWPAALGSDINPLAIRKALFGTPLFRDYNAQATSLTGFTPFATDGNILTTLTVANGGTWVDPGGVSDTGPEMTPNITVSQTMIWQSRRTQRSDIDKDEDTLDIAFRESNPIVQCLRLNRPLADALDPGQIGAGLSKPNYSDTLERQACIIGVDGSTGRNVFFARVYPRIVISKLGKQSWNPKNAIDTPLTWDVLTDPYTIGPDGMVAPPFFELEEGPGHRALGGTPNFGTIAPVATAGTTGKASVVFANPTGGDVKVVTYTGEKSTDGGTTWSAGAFDGASWAAATTSAGGSTTVKFGTLTAGSTKLRVIATGDNGVTVTSAGSNAVTVT